MNTKDAMILIIGMLAILSIAIFTFYGQGKLDGRAGINCEELTQ